MSARRYVTATELEVIQMSLSNRDMAILRTLRAYHQATGAQLRRLHFTDHASQSAAERAARHGLRRLADIGVIDHLERRIGGVRSGSTGYVFYLARVGYRLLAAMDGTALPARIDTAEPSLRKLDHTLAITEVGVRLAEVARAEACEVIECTPEPSCWRSYLSAGGGRMTLKPDLFAVTATTGEEYERVQFLEVDRCTESPATLQRKAQQYEAYRRTGREQQTQGVFPHVVWLTPDEARAERITAALAKAPKVDAAIHQAMTLDQYIAELTRGGQL